MGVLSSTRPIIFIWLLEMLVTLRSLSHLAPLAKEFSHFLKGKGTDVHTQTLKLPYKVGLSYRQQRNLLGVLLLLVILAFGDCFQQEFYPAVMSLCVSDCHGLSTAKT